MATMSLRQWNTLSERIRFQNYVELSYRLLLYKISVGDFDDDDDDDDDDDHMSVDSDSSDSSESSCDTVEFLLRKTRDYGSYIYKRFEDPNINWDASPPLIFDMSESECNNEFRFRKEHLQIVSKKLWNLMQPHLEGNYDSIRVENRYTLPFKTCFMFLLYRLSVPRRIQPDMERFLVFKSPRSQQR
jgi:hypothetical protein